MPSAVTAAISRLELTASGADDIRSGSATYRRSKSHNARCAPVGARRRACLDDPLGYPGTSPRAVWRHAAAVRHIPARRASRSVRRRCVAEIRLARPAELDRQRHAVPVHRLADGNAHPALADAVFLNIGLLDALEAD